MQELIKEESQLLRQIVKKFVDASKSASSNNLPCLPTELEPLADRLGKTDFTLVVSGEVNRGKSTFINAIIGQEILPTYDKETTSQVFKIKNSEEESFFVVLDDGERLQIRKDELKKYGTELTSSDINSVLGGKRILYIEVNVRFVNLPQNVTIVDTPGIGSTFKSHTEIAKSFMQEADAVIYICSSKHPIVKVDIDFIKKTILPIKTYPNVLFVMAKADLADSEDALVTIVNRAEEQLKEQFGNIPNIGKRVIPIDSLSLRESCVEMDSETSNLLRSTSNFDAVNDEINKLIDRQRFMWLIATYNCVAKYYRRVNQFLEKQIADFDLNEKSRKEKLDSIEKRISRFESELGINRQREVLEKITNILTSLRSDVKTEFDSEKSSLLKKYNSLVDNLPSGLSSESLNNEAQALFANLIDDATSTWDELCAEALSNIQSALNSYHKECMFEVEDEYNLSSSSNDDFSVDVSVTMSERIDAMRGKYFSALFGTTVGVFAITALGTVSTTASAIASSIAFGPAGFVVAGAAIAYGLFYGNKKAKEKALNKAKADIKARIREILEEIYNKLTATSLMHGKHESMLKSFEKSIQEGATDTISEIYNKTLSELQSSKTAILNSSNPKNRIKLVNQQTLFNNFAIELQKMRPELAKISADFEMI